MKKETLLEIILGTIGGLVFSIGMCMVLILKWNMLKEGIIVGIVGFIISLFIIPVYKSNHPKKESHHINWNIIITWMIGIIGALIMGFGMSKVMIENSSKTNLLTGIIISIVGLLMCILNYPIYSYLKDNKIIK